MGINERLRDTDIHVGGEVKLGERINVGASWGVAGATSPVFDYVTLEGLLIVPDVQTRAWFYFDSQMK